MGTFRIEVASQGISFEREAVSFSYYSWGSACRSHVQATVDLAFSLPKLGIVSCVKPSRHTAFYPPGSLSSKLSIVSMAAPAWPPPLQSLKGALLAETVQLMDPLHRLNLLLYNVPLRPSNDEQLVAARVAQGDDVRRWTAAEQVGWIMRRPIGEWLYYVRDVQRSTAILSSRLSPCDESNKLGGFVVSGSQHARLTSGISCF